MRVLRGLCLLLTFVSLQSCNLGPDSRELGAGYRVKKVDEQHFALVIPHQSGGRVIDEIGWDKPFILARATGSDFWDVIDTAHAERTQVSDQDRKTNANLEK